MQKTVVKIFNGCSCPCDMFPVDLPANLDNNMILIARYKGKISRVFN